MPIVDNLKPINTYRTHSIQWRFEAFFIIVYILSLLNIIKLNKPMPKILLPNKFRLNSPTLVVYVVGTYQVDIE